MASHDVGLMHVRACVVRGKGREEVVTCPHCRGAIPLAKTENPPPGVSVACPHCEEPSLLVRVVSELHRAVLMPKGMLATLERELVEAARPEPAVRTPAEIYALPVSRGAVVLLAMMWNRAEQTGSMQVESSVAELSRRLMTSRSMVRGWLGELQAARVVREVSSAGQRPRVWELLPVPRKEVGHAE